MTCRNCGSVQYVDKITDYASDRVPAEITFNCGNCGEFLNSWAYGNWEDPHGPKPGEEDEIQTQEGTPPPPPPCQFCETNPSTDHFSLADRSFTYCEAPECMNQLRAEVQKTPAYWPPEWIIGKKFSLDLGEAKRFSEWTKTLPDADIGAIGGRYTFSFTATGLGLIVNVKDGITGQEIDLTDYDMW